MVSETYDEIVFVNPPDAFFRLLSAPATRAPFWAIEGHFCRFEELGDLHALAAAQEWVDCEIAGIGNLLHFSIQ